MNYLFRSARVIDPARSMDETADVLVLEGRVAEVGPFLDVPPDRLAGVEEIRLEGKWLTPGWVDMHVHLREPGEEYKETVATGARAAAAGGYAAVACMPNTRPVNDGATVTRFILERAREAGASRVYPVSAVSRGSLGEEMAEIADAREAGAVAVTDDGRPVASSRLMRHALEYCRPLDIPVISHAEDLGLSEGGQMNEGALSTMLGLPGIPAAAEEIAIARDILLAELTGGRLHVAHVSTAGAVRLLREAKKRGIPVTAETAPHYFTLTEDLLSAYDAVYKMNPPLRTARDVEAIKEGLADGTLDAIATDHAPHSVLEKDTEFSLAANGVIGLESAMPLILELVREGLLTPMEAVAKVTCNPTRILGVPGGALKRGEPADIVVIDPLRRFVLNRDEFQSKSRNCPFHGREAQGRALRTVVGGKTVFSRM